MPPEVSENVTVIVIEVKIAAKPQTMQGRLLIKALVMLTSIAHTPCCFGQLALRGEAEYGIDSIL